jgi:hypothetical protein
VVEKMREMGRMEVMWKGIRVKKLLSEHPH